MSYVLVSNTILTIAGIQVCVVEPTWALAVEYQIHNLYLII